MCMYFICQKVIFFRIHVKRMDPFMFLICMYLVGVNPFEIRSKVYILVLSMVPRQYIARQTRVPEIVPEYLSIY